MNFLKTSKGTRILLGIGLIIFGSFFVVCAPPIKSVSVEYELVPNYSPTSEEYSRVNKKMENKEKIDEVWPMVNGMAYKNGDWYKIVISEPVFSLKNILYSVFIVLSISGAYYILSGLFFKFH